MSQPIIDLKTVHLSLGSGAGRVHILRGTNLAVAPGETVGLIGPSGSGKSSLLSVMAGLERPDEGRVKIAGEDVTRLDEDRLATFRAKHIGIIFQSFHLIANMTALENVAVPLEFAGRGDAFARARAMLDRVGLGARATHYPAELSGGEQQRVAIARALAGAPAILFADEPTGNLDAETGARVADLMFTLQKEQGTTFVLVTHDEALARRCDRILEMAAGLVRAPDAPDAHGKAAAE